MECACSCHSAGKDLSAVGNVFAEFRYIFVIDSYGFVVAVSVVAECADLFVRSSSAALILVIRHYISLLCRYCSERKVFIGIKCSKIVCRSI